MTTLFPDDFGTVFRQRRSASLGDRQSLSGPCAFSDARVIAFHDISGTSELVQLAILTTAGRNGERQQCSAVPLDAFQHREERWNELQITPKAMASNGRRISLKIYGYKAASPIPNTISIVFHCVKK